MQLSNYNYTDWQRESDGFILILYKLKSWQKRLQEMFKKDRRRGENEKARRKLNKT